MLLHCTDEGKRVKKEELFPGDHKPADDRPAAKNMGLIAISILVFVGCLIVIPDILTLIYKLVNPINHKQVQKVRQKKSKNRKLRQTKL